jgi:hypothetical protein
VKKVLCGLLVLGAALLLTLAWGPSASAVTVEARDSYGIIICGKIYAVIVVYSDGSSRVFAQADEADTALAIIKGIPHEHNHGLEYAQNCPMTT